MIITSMTLAIVMMFPVVLVLVTMVLVMATTAVVKKSNEDCDDRMGHTTNAT